MPRPPIERVIPGFQEAWHRNLLRSLLPKPRHIRFADPRGIDFSYLLSMLHDSFMSRANTIVCPGGKMDLAMQLIFTPMIWRLIERRKQALGH